MIYEIATFQALRDQLRCKDIWVVRADRWRNPDEDLPQDFEQRRTEHYAALSKPLDPSEFIEEVRSEMRPSSTRFTGRCPILTSLKSPIAASRGRSSSRHSRRSPSLRT